MDVQQHTNREFDLLVIGGGITGAGITLDAQSRGLSTCLVEMQDFAAGTSSRSTKLIHAGIRYMKQGNFSLVKETGRERSILTNIAPHLSRPIEVFIPIYNKKNQGYKKWQLTLAMYFFEWLVKVPKKQRHRSYSKKEAFEKEPLVNQEDLIGAISYTERITDDARLVLSNLLKARDLGAACYNYLKVESFLSNEGDYKIIKCVHQLTGEEIIIKAKNIVNATGPWVDEIRKLENQHVAKKLILTKGIHLVFRKEKFPIHSAIYFPATDNRMVFAIPREEKVYIGTTDTFYKADKQHPTVTQEDVSYLLQAINAKFLIALTVEDIESAWSGLRPLVGEEGKKPSEISRKDEIFISDSGIISIAGGKLTGYRLMAKKVVDLLSSVATKTETIVLKGGEKVENELPSTSYVKQLRSIYGSDANQIVTIYDSLVDKDDTWRQLKAMLLYSLKNEWVVKPSDFVTRRIGFTYFNKPLVEHYKEKLLQEMGEQLCWSEKEATCMRADLESALYEIYSN